MVKDLGVQSGSNSGKLFLTFSCTVLPHSDCSIGVSQPCDLQLFAFSL